MLVPDEQDRLCVGVVLVVLGLSAFATGTVTDISRHGVSGAIGSPLWVLAGGTLLIGGFMLYSGVRQWFSRRR